MSARISARLDPATQAKLQALQAQTRKSVTELISEALDLYWRQHGGRAERGNRGLLSLAGIFEGPADLSERYKEHLAQGLDDKLAGHR